MIPIKDVKKLRDQTGAGITDCQKALKEAAGDFEKAIEYLRKKGQKVSAARADKDTTEGAVFVQTNASQTLSTMIALSCETDFVAKTEAFQTLGTKIVEAACKHQPADTDALLQLAIDGQTVQETLTRLIGNTGEKITISTYKALHSEVVVPYIHTGSKLGVLVGLKGAQGTQALAVGQDVAMQIAAMNPLSLDQESIDPEIVARELAIVKELARNEGKPEAMLEKIAQGRLTRFFKESTLLAQPFVKDSAMTVAQYLKTTAPSLTITAFERVTVAG